MHPAKFGSHLSLKILGMSDALVIMHIPTKEAHVPRFFFAVFRCHFKMQQRAYEDNHPFWFWFLVLGLNLVRASALCSALSHSGWVKIEDGAHFWCSILPKVFSASFALFWSHSKLHQRRVKEML